MNQDTDMEYSEKQQQILDVAEKLFALNGFEATSVRDIASEAGVNIAMISYYFGSKEKLLQHIFSRHANYIRLQLENLIQNPDMNFLEKIDSLIDTYLEKYFSQQDFHKIVAREQMKNEDSEINAILHNMKKTNQCLIKKLIHEGQKAGDFKKHVDTPLLMSTMIGTANQLMTTKHFYKEINNLQHMSEDDFQKHLRKKLSAHLKTIFKAILTHE